MAVLLLGLVIRSAYSSSVARREVASCHCAEVWILKSEACAEDILHETYRRYSRESTILWEFNQLPVSITSAWTL